MKVWISNKHTNYISHRKLDTFEKRNPQMFALSRQVHDSWEDAHKATIGFAEEALKKAQRELKSAERRLAKAKSLVRPAARGVEIDQREEA